MLRNGSRRHGRGIPSPFRYFLCVLYLSGLACSADPVGPAETGIEGQVLRGPAAPGPEVRGQANEMPFSAIFYVLDLRENQVAQFQSDEQGRFRVRL